MKVSRREVLCRALTGCCPNCGKFGVFRSWFRLRKQCQACPLILERDESGFYLGTTSLGYVLALLLVIVPICILVVRGALSVWVGVGLGMLGSLGLCLLLYPVLLCWVLMLAFVVQAEELPANAEPLATGPDTPTAPSPHSES